ncbi:unnamed protein product [Cunninghamella blakesleeana]
MQLNRRHSWLYNWIPTWYKKEQLDHEDIYESNGQSRRGKKRLHFGSGKKRENSMDYINDNSSLRRNSNQPTIIDTGYVSPPLSSSNSSMTSSSRRKTKSSILDVFYLRKTSSQSTSSQYIASNNNTVSSDINHLTSYSNISHHQQQQQQRKLTQRLFQPNLCNNNNNNEDDSEMNSAAIHPSSPSISTSLKHHHDNNNNNNNSCSNNNNDNDNNSNNNNSNNNNVDVKNDYTTTCNINNISIEHVYNNNDCVEHIDYTCTTNHPSPSHNNNNNNSIVKPNIVNHHHDIYNTSITSNSHESMNDLMNKNISNSNQHHCISSLSTLNVINPLTHHHHINTNTFTTNTNNNNTNYTNTTNINNNNNGGFFSLIHHNNNCNINNNNNATAGSVVLTANEDTIHRSSTSTHRSSSLPISTTTIASHNNNSQSYTSILSKDGQLYEYNTEMEFNDPPTVENNERICLRHELVQLALDGLFKCPLSPNKEIERQILHIGCGDGSWCIDMARKYPNYFIVGIDDQHGGPFLSTTTTGKKIIINNNMNKPGMDGSGSGGSTNGSFKNFNFIRTTTNLVESLKKIADDQFDLVYGRFLTLGLSPRQYEALVTECWRICKPGGFVEFTELDMRIYGNPTIGPFTTWLNEQLYYVMGKKRKLDPRLPRHLQDMFFKLLVDQSPTNRQNSYNVMYNSLPLGVWGGRLGVMFRDDIHDILDHFHIATTCADKNGNPLTEKEWQSTCDLLDDELEAEMAFMNLYQIYAQKK